MSTRAAVYVRISRDREGAGLGVERQERECRSLADRLGLDVVVVHADNDLSAYSGKPRPGYRALLGDLTAGRIDVVLCWHTDRLHRSVIELEEWIAVCETHGVTVHAVQAGQIDLTTAGGMLNARLAAVIARGEVDRTRERVRAAKRQAADAGRWRGGRRPFGFEPDGVTVRESEASVIRDVTDRILAGESIHAVARELNGDGVQTSTGREWRPPELRAVVLRARNAGLIEHDGEVVGPAAWEAIVAEPVWRNLRRLLTAPGRRQARSADQVWLGSGVYLCGRCGDGTTMRSATTRTNHRGGGSAPSYRCRTGSHLTRIAEPLDEFVTELVLERLSRPDARLLLAPQDRRRDVESLNAERADVESSLEDLAALVADRTFTRAQARAASADLNERLERLDLELTGLTASSPLSGFADAEDVRVAWLAAAVGRRKAIVRALMTVTLLPAPKGRPAGWAPRAGRGYFDARAVRIDWHDD